MWKLNVPTIANHLEQVLQHYPGFASMYFYAGSKMYDNQGVWPAWLDEQEKLLLAGHLRPVESYAPNENRSGVQDEWNLFFTYIAVFEGAGDSAKLSTTMKRWKQDMVVPPCTF